MNIPVTWSITNVWAASQVEDLTNVIVRAAYRVVLTDTYQGRHIDAPADAPLVELPLVLEDGGVARFELDPSGEFIPFEQLTKEIVLGWVKSQLGDRVTLIETALRDRAEAIKNPKPPEIVQLELP